MPRRRSWTRWLRWTLWLIGVVTACGGLALMASDIDEIGRPIAIVAAADVLLGMAFLVSRDSLDPRHTGRALSSAVAPIVSALVVEVVVGFLLFPVTLEEGSDPDRSWFGVVPLVVVLIGGGATMLAILLYVMVVAPAIILAVVAPQALRGDPQARASALLSLILIDIVAMCSALAFVVDDGGGRAGVLTLLATVLGLRDPLAGSSDLQLWVARTLVLLFGALIVAMVLLVRRHPEVDRVWQDQR